MRIVVAMIPIVITIPLALMGFLYWSLIIGTLASEFVYALILTAKSEWKPGRYYSLNKLKKMFSFSIWSLVEQFTIWVACYADTLILSVFLSDYMVGMYKQPESMISSVFNIFAATFFTILFSALSRMNDVKDENGFWEIVFKTQLMSAIIIFPLSAGIYLYRELVTNIILGAQWKMAIDVVGFMALSTGLQTVMNSTASEIYRAKGEPKVSVVAQILYILCLIPLSVIGILQGFEIFVKIRAFISAIFMLIHYSIIRFRYKISFDKVLKNIKYPLIATIVMSVCVWMVQRVAKTNLLVSAAGIPFGVIIYILVVCYFKPVRQIIYGIITKFSENGTFSSALVGVKKILNFYEKW